MPGKDRAGFPWRQRSFLFSCSVFPQLQDFPAPEPGRKALVLSQAEAAALSAEDGSDPEAEESR